MKSKLIIVLFLVSVMLLATNNIIQALIAISGLGLSIYLINKNKKEVTKTIFQIESKVLTTLKIK